MMTVIKGIIFENLVTLGVMVGLFLGLPILAEAMAIHKEGKRQKAKAEEPLLSKFLRTKKLDPEAVDLVRGSEGSAGMDMCAIETKTILPHSKEVFRTGWAMEIPGGCVGLIFARSGLSTKHGIRPTTCVSVIDSDYRGEVMIGLYNDGDQPFTVNKGDRVAQLVIVEYAKLHQLPVKELSDTNRGEGGFGSTGRK